MGNLSAKDQFASYDEKIRLKRERKRTTQTP